MKTRNKKEEQMLIQLRQRQKTVNRKKNMGQGMNEFLTAVFIALILIAAMMVLTYSPTP